MFTLSQKISLRTKVDGIIYDQETALVDELGLRENRTYGMSSKWMQERKQKLIRQAALLGVHR